MRNYVVYFELYGKKMKTTVLAKSEQAAKEIVKNKITFYKVEEKTLSELEKIANYFKGKGQ